MKEILYTIDPNCKNVNPIRHPAKEADIGRDLVSWIDNETGSMTIPARQFVNVPTGVSVELPVGYWGLIAGRSSTFAKKGLLVMNGIIDQGYRGQLYIVLFNLTDQPTTIHNGDRLAQLIPVGMDLLGLKHVSSLSDSERGATGFGSSGET